MFYSLYGLRLEANVPIPGLTPFVCDQRPDLWVRLGAMPRWLDDFSDVSEQVWYASPDYNGQREPLLTVRPSSASGPRSTVPTLRYPYLTGPGKSPS